MNPNSLVAVGDESGRVKIARWFEADDNGPDRLVVERSWRVGSHAVDCVALGLQPEWDDDRVLVAMRDGSILWKTVANGNCAAEDKVDPMDADVKQRPLWLMAAVAGVDGPVVAVTKDDATVRIRDRSSLRETSAFRCAKTELSAAALAPANDVVAVGGPDREVELFSLETATSSFKARPAKQSNPYAVLRPTSVTAVDFMASGQSTCGVVSGTEYGRIRLHDTSAGQRRPVVEAMWMEEVPITAVRALDERRVVIGDRNGNMGVIDLRRDVKQIERFRSAGAGSLRDIQASKENEVLLTVGFDQFCRIYHSGDRKSPRCRLHLKQRLTSAAIPADFGPSSAPPRPNEEDPEESLDSGDDSEDEVESDEQSKSKKPKRSYT